MWNLFAPDRLGYHEKVVTERSLKSRMLLAWRTDPDAVCRLLQRNGVSYQIDSCGDFMRFIAFLDKPLAELLDEINVPRERIDNHFIEFEGPLPYNPNQVVIRRITPGLVSQPKGFVVQPMMKHIENLPIMAPLDISGIWPLGSPEAWKEVSKIANELHDSRKNEI